MIPSYNKWERILGKISFKNLSTFIDNITEKSLTNPTAINFIYLEEYREKSH